MEYSLKQMKQSLIEILSKEKGYFGRVFTWGQVQKEYVYIGYELTEDIMPTLEAMTEEQKKNLRKIIVYFEVHAGSLKRLLEIKEVGLHQIYADIAWSHFMTVIMFGMLEISVKITNCAKLNKSGYLMKYQSIECFLETYLPLATREDIASRYQVEEFFNVKVNNFSDVVKHLWNEIRSGFVHEGNWQSKGLEWMSFRGGLGSKEEPIKVVRDVPMQELLQITWQAILNSYGYRGLLISPKINWDK